MTNRDERLGLGNGETSREEELTVQYIRVRRTTPPGRTFSSSTKCQRLKRQEKEIPLNKGGQHPKNLLSVVLRCFHHTFAALCLLVSRVTL